MGTCAIRHHTVAITVEELVLDPPYEHSVIQGAPVVYIKQDDRLLNFTTVLPTTVGISCAWNQVRYLKLEEKDPPYVSFVIGENPRFKGYLDQVRSHAGEVLIEINEVSEDGRNLGSVGVLRVEITQQFQAPEPVQIADSHFKREGYDANLSVFLYEARGVSKELLVRKNGAMGLDVDLAIHAPEDDVRVPTLDFEASPAALRKKDTVAPVWNEGFHWNNLVEEPRFLDVRFNPDSKDLSQVATARIDLLEQDAWAKGQDWEWHPIIADDRRDQQELPCLLVDDTANGPELERLLGVLHMECVFEANGEEALSMLAENKHKLLEEVHIIFVNVQQNGGIDGIAFAQRVRELEATLNFEHSIPIIALDSPMPGSTLERDRRILQTQMLDDLLHTPVRKAQLRWTLQRYLRNMGTVLLDIVVTYTPSGVLGHSQSKLAKWRRMQKVRMLQASQEQKMVAAQNQLQEAQPTMNGLLELTIEQFTLRETIPENRNVVYVVTLNQQVLQTTRVKRVHNSVIAKSTPIVWNERVRLWVRNLADAYTASQPLNLGVGLYAYPVGQDGWHSDDLIGQWTSTDQEDNFWVTCHSQYASYICQLTRSDRTGFKRKRGFFAMRAIVRPAQEVAERLMHNAFVRSSNGAGRVGRGEVGKLNHALRPLIQSPEELDAEDEDSEYLSDPEDDFDEDADGGGARFIKYRPRYKHKALHKIDSFVRDAPHYSYNGQSYVTEEHVMELINLRQHSQI